MLLFLEPGLRHYPLTRCCNGWLSCSTSATTSTSSVGSFRVRGDVVEVYPSYQEDAYLD